MFPTTQEVVDLNLNQDLPHAKVRWYPTDLGKCLRGVYYERKGEIKTREMDIYTYRVFQCGHLFEDFVVSSFNKYASVNNIQVETQKRVEISDWDVGGYADLIASKDGTSRVYEFKTVHSFKFRYIKENNGPDEQHKQQLWTYLYGLKIDSGSLVYIQKDRLYCSEFQVNLNDEKLEHDVRTQYEILNKAWKTQELPPVPETITKKGRRHSINWQAAYCNYHALCLNDPEWKELSLIHI